jgi:hypothetical protein
VCPLRRSEGGVFFTEIQRFSWNRIVGVNPLPRGASVGEFRKNLSPSKREFDEIYEISFQGGWIYEDLEPRTCEAPKSRTCEDLESRTCEASKSQICEDLESWTWEAPKSRTGEDLESWTCEALKSRVCENTESWICEIRESTEVQIRELRRVKISMNERLMNQ